MYGAFVVYFNVNFNVLKQIYCALVGVIKGCISQNAWYNCGNARYNCENARYNCGNARYNCENAWYN
jgi:hypothetical protein